MKKSFVKTFTGRFLDIVFGNRLDTVDAESAPAAAPPHWMNKAYGALLLSAAAVVLFSFFAKLGWLPVDYSPIMGALSSFAVLASLLLRLVWEQIQKHYERRAEAWMAPTP